MTTVLEKGQSFRAHVFDGVKASRPKSSVVKRPSPIRVWVGPMTMARVLRSRMLENGHVRFGAPRSI